MRITRRLEFDAGHRIPNHISQCRHLHGHRYAIEITLRGNIIRRAGDAAQRARAEDAMAAIVAAALSDNRAAPTALAEPD